MSYYCAKVKIEWVKTSQVTCPLHERLSNIRSACPVTTRQKIPTMQDMHRHRHTRQGPRNR